MKNSKILRLLCYILIPILVAILVISFVYTYLKERNQAQAEFYENNYFDSDYFLVQYMFEVIHMMVILKYVIQAKILIQK